MPFTVDTVSFQGPLDLLLDLVEKKKLFINDISLSEVADEFVEHVQASGAMPMAESAHFILVASTLLLIKSRSLIPGLLMSEEEQHDIRDLELRLKIYGAIREGSAHVRRLFAAAPIFEQSASREIAPLFAPDPGFTLEKAVSFLSNLIERLPKKESLPAHLIQKVISLEEMIGALEDRISRTLKMSFSQFTEKHRGERLKVIVSFLAMLELVRSGRLLVSQHAALGEITMETKEVGVPHY